MIKPEPVTLEGRGIRLEPLTVEHHNELVAAASDGELWNLWFTGVPRPEEMRRYISEGEAGRSAGHMVPWAVRDLESGAVIGSTRFANIIAEIDRVEVGYTWYAKSRQRTHVNSTCKLLLFSHAFETVGCKVVSLTTDRFNFVSQRAIEALGAHKDGIIRHYCARRDGTARDSVMYSILLNEWPDVKRNLQERLARNSGRGA